ncbi:30S ribosomal protein S21, chloroplastic isoform X2 [Lathyrus oleraceus]|nr:30S ribosomal protein S21, chloroplastic-like isoform X2 [Pisum sativum]
MAVLSLLPTTTRPLSLSLPPSSSSTRRDNNSNICQVSFSPIAYPKLFRSNSTALLPLKSSIYNVEILVEEDEPEDKLLSRFRKEVIIAGVFQECRRRKFFENPIDKIKRKRREAAKRNRRRRYFRTPVPDKCDTPNKEKVDDGEEEDN